MHFLIREQSDFPNKSGINPTLSPHLRLILPLNEDDYRVVYHGKWSNLSSIHFIIITAVNVDLIMMYL